MKRYPKFTAYGHQYRPVSVSGEQDFHYLWDDVFTDMSAYAEDGGADWTGWGTSDEQPAEVPLEWFLRNVVSEERPTGARIRLESPTGEIFITDRMQPPSGSMMRDWLLDLSGNDIYRGISDRNWGQLHLWGELVEDAAVPQEGVVGTLASVGATSLVLGTGEGSVAFLNAVGPGSVVEIRTNATAPDYHPAESRTTVFVDSVNVETRTINLALPLEITVPVNNATGDFEGEISDPSTLKLLAGSVLSANANKGDNSVQVSNASHFRAGDWILVFTIEVPAPNGCQFLDGVGDDEFDVDPLEEFGENPILCNEELHQVLSVVGNRVNLVGTLGKNKLMAWQASAIRIDPIIGATITGGNWLGYMDHEEARAWDHQYVWGRYMVDCTIKDMVFDEVGGSELGDAVKRIGQAVRLDSGEGNLIEGHTIYAGGSILAGEGYGISLRRGERNTIVHDNWITSCRHSIEFWGTSGGCVALSNTCLEDTSSSIDTHGSWNVGVRIEGNLIGRSAEAEISPDTVGWTDAIRIGNNKFIWDEDILVLNNEVTNYQGAALSIVPGARRVTVDGLTVLNAQRIVRLTNNSRHDDVFAEDITIRNVVGDIIKDRLTEISHSVSGKVVCKGLVLENWTIGGSGQGTVGADSRNIRVLDCEDVMIHNVNLDGIATAADQYTWWFEDITGLVLAYPTQNGGERGVSLRNVTGVSGTITITNLTDAPSTAYLVRADGTNSGVLTVNHNQNAPATISTGIALTLVGAA